MQSSDSESSNYWDSSSESYSESYEGKPPTKYRTRKIKRKRMCSIQLAMRRLASMDIIDVEKVVDALNGKDKVFPLRHCHDQYCDVVAEIPESCVQMSKCVWKSHYYTACNPLSRRITILHSFTDYFSPTVYKDDTERAVYIVLANKNDQIKAILDEFFGDSYAHIMSYISYVIYYHFGKYTRHDSLLDLFGFGSLANDSSDEISMTIFQPDDISPFISQSATAGDLNCNTTSSANDSTDSFPVTSFQPDDFSAFISQNCKKDSDPSINSFGIDTSSDVDILSQTVPGRIIFADFTFPHLKSLI